MNAQEFKKPLSRRGCIFENRKGGSGHLTIRLGERVSRLPIHGSRKELGKGLVRRIYKELGLK